jgi:cytoskeletal protein CcmA (bactofilin family)
VAVFEQGNTIMAIWGNKTREDEDTPLDATPAPASSNVGTGPAPRAITGGAARSGVTVIAAGAVVSGSISSGGDIQVDGVVQGDVRAETVTVGNGGAVEGSVTGTVATVRGKVTGNVTARSIQLAGTGAIAGDLTHAILVIEEGGAFEGRSKRLADPLADVPALPAAAAPAVSAPEPASALAGELGDGFVNS